MLPFLMGRLAWSMAKLYKQRAAMLSSLNYSDFACNDFLAKINVKRTHSLYCEKNADVAQASARRRQRRFVNYFIIYNVLLNI